MNNTLSLPVVMFFLIVAALCADLRVDAEEVSFNRDVRPILADRCFACHGFDPQHREAGLRLDTFEGATADRDGARAIVPGDPNLSQIWHKVTSSDPAERMPPAHSNKPPLSPTQLDVLKRWIAQGARYERDWSFVPPTVSIPPALPGVANPIDGFVLSRLAELGMDPSPPAALETLIRRVALDLTGLPPTLEQLDEFLQKSEQDAEAAYIALVDRTLQSPHYGERWGRWWLDQARYADSNGYSIDAPRQIWKFRDWVVGALNADMPFDQFTIEQLAGDLLANASQNQKIATGFHRNTQINQEGGIDKEQFRIDSVFDRVATTGTVWLGLSIGCAQCHDHKFDPIEQKEYYRLFAFLNNQDEPAMTVFDDSIDVSAFTAEFQALEARIKAYMTEHNSEFEMWEAQLTPESKKLLPPSVVKLLDVSKPKRTTAQLQELFVAGVGSAGPFREWNDRHRALESHVKPNVTTMVMSELRQPRRTTVFIKGDFTRPAEEVSPGTPAVLHPLEATRGRPNRIDLAKWLVSSANPLTARVVVNRVWQHYFGRGIVETENDFGRQGTPPTHPELLDWLASELIAHDWSLKWLHRVIVTSGTYRQSSSLRRDLEEKDPNNYWLARQRRLRLDGEVVRDVALTAAGLLQPKLGGPPVFPPIPEGVMGQGQVKREWSTSQGADRYRRGLYTFVYRASPPPSLNVFDAPDGFSSCTRRVRSNNPLQALTLMNDAAYFEFAAALERTLQLEGLASTFRRCTGRRPSEEELAVLTKLNPLIAARALLNLDETITRE